MSDAFMFTHDVAVQYLEDMVSRAGSGEADDLILFKYTIPHFSGRLLNGKPTTCYVAHGRNDSSNHWMRKPPEELK